VWGALWLHRAHLVKNPKYGNRYLQRAEAEYEALKLAGGYRDGQSWANMKPGVYVLLSQLTGKPGYRDEARRWGDYWSVGLPITGERSAYTPGGMAYGRDDAPTDPQIWGSLRNSCNQAFVALVFAKAEKDPALRTRYEQFAKGQVDYALGANPQRNCYLIGFQPTGTKTFVASHHRTAYGAWAGFNHLMEKSPVYNVTRPRHLLIGALLGGPDKQDRFTNSVADFKQCEVAVDYNAGFTAALAPLFGTYGGAPLTAFPPKERRDDEFFVEASVGHDTAFSEIRAWVNNRSAWPARVTEDMAFRYYVTLPKEIQPAQIRVSVKSPDGAVTGAATLIQGSGRTCYALVRFPRVPNFPGGWDSKTGRSHYRKEAVVRLEYGTAEGRLVQHWSGANLPGLNAEPSKAARIPLYNAEVRLSGEVFGAAR
jgi:endoglucanase